MIVHQPLDYLEAVGEDFVRYFDPDVSVAPVLGPVAGGDLVRLPRSDSGARRRQTHSTIVTTGSSSTVSGAQVLATYQAIFRVGGVVLLAAFVATVLGMFLARGALRLGTVLFGLSALALYLGPVITNSYDFRYGIPPGALIAISGILGACGMLVRYRPARGVLSARAPGLGSAGSAPAWGCPAPARAAPPRRSHPRP